MAPQLLPIKRNVGNVRSPSFRFYNSPFRYNTILVFLTISTPQLTFNKQHLNMIYLISQSQSQIIHNQPLASFISLIRSPSLKYFTRKFCKEKEINYFSSFTLVRTRSKFTRSLVIPNTQVGVYLKKNAVALPDGYLLEKEISPCV